MSTIGCQQKINFNQPAKVDGTFSKCKDVDECDHGCKNGESGACVELGRVYTSGVGVPKDEARGFHYYERACALGATLTGCYWAAYGLEHGRGTPPDRVRARDLYLRMCKEENYKRACAAAEDLK